MDVETAGPTICSKNAKARSKGLWIQESSIVGNTNTLQWSTIRNQVHVSSWRTHAIVWV